MKRFVPLMFLMACTALETPAPPAQPAPLPQHFSDHWTPVDRADQGQAWAHPDQVPKGQMPRRLEVDHLRNSIPHLFDGIQWLDDSENSMWDRLSRTLGEADYLEVTQTNNDPSPLFAKFMDDMASQVCQKALDRDAQTTNAEDRVLVRHPEDVDQNLRWLRLKLHGVLSDSEGDASIQAYRQLHASLLAQTNLGQAWLGVCMAMLTAPEFMTY